MKNLFVLGLLFISGCGYQPTEHIRPDIAESNPHPYNSPDKLHAMPAPTPPATNFPWAPDASYPAGADPWSAQPTKVDPTDDMFTPGQSAPATNFNSIINARDTYLADVAAHSIGLQPSHRLIAMHHVASTDPADDNPSANIITAITSAAYTVTTLIDMGAIWTFVAGDIVEVELSGVLTITGTAGFPTDYGVFGLTKEDGGGLTQIAGAKALIGSPIDSAEIMSPFSISGKWIYASGDTGVIKVRGKVAGVSTLRWAGPYHLSVKQWRAVT